MITAQAITTASRAMLRICWPGSWIGRPGMISCSLPKAMFEPQNEIEPTIAANRIGMSCSSSGLPPVCSSASRYSTNEISATAPPPTPLNSATICGIAVIFTLRAAGTPTAVPIAMPTSDQEVVADEVVEQRPDDRERHPDRGQHVAPARGARVVEEAQPDDEADEGDDVEDPDEVRVLEEARRWYISRGASA